jgi:predicted ATPase
MNDIFITKVQIEKVRHLKNLTIPLSDTERKHLILTGKNGSGKTSVLESVKDCINEKQSPGRNKLHGIIDISGTATRKNYITIFSNILYWKESFFLFFPAHHNLHLSQPRSIEKIDINRKFGIDADASANFLKYMLFLDYQRLSAENEGTMIEARSIDKWFINFEKTLCAVYDCPELKLVKEVKDLTFKIIMPNREPFGLDEMADGYSAFLKIVMELMMRMESTASGAYDMPGIVLVDEIETHLHVELQKKVLPFLTRMFPNIQFVVTTHSPFVISSLENAVVFDLEKQEPMEDLSAYSYSILAENYFDVDKYSVPIKEKIMRIEYLCNHERNQDEEAELKKIISYLYKIPQGALDTELALKLQSFRLQYPELFSGDTK